MNTVVHSPLYLVRGMRGLGALGQPGDGSVYAGPSGAVSDTSNIDPNAFDPNAPTYTLNQFPTAGTTATGQVPASSGQGFNWTSFLNTLVGQAGATARADITPLSVLPPGSSYISTPSGTAVTTGGNVSAANLLSSLQTGNLLPILLIGGVGLVVVMMMMSASHK